MSATTLTCNYLQWIISQDSVPQKKQLVCRQIARKGPHHPLKGDTQPGDKTITSVCIVDTWWLPEVEVYSERKVRTNHGHSNETSLICSPLSLFLSMNVFHCFYSLSYEIVIPVINHKMAVAHNYIVRLQWHCSATRTQSVCVQGVCDSLKQQLSTEIWSYWYMN